METKAQTHHVANTENGSSTKPSGLTPSVTGRELLFRDSSGLSMVAGKADRKSLRILAQSVCRELADGGLSRDEMILFAAELVGTISENASENR